MATAKKKATVIPFVANPHVIAVGTASNVKIKANIMDSGIVAQVTVEIDGEYVDDTTSTGKVIEICTSGWEDILGATDQEFENTVAIAKAIRAKYKAITPKT